MKIAFVTNHPIEGDGYPGRAGYQKTAKSMYQVLVDQGFQVDGLAIGKAKRSLASYAFEGIARVYRKRYTPHLEPSALDSYARQASAWLARNPVDVVFSSASMLVAHLDRTEPVVLWRDSTFAGALQVHRNFRNLGRRAIAQGNAMEQRALDRATLAIFRSDWAAQTAIDHYGIDPAKVKVIPTGGNLDFAVTEAEVRRHIFARAADPVCRLLFIGVDWETKGGDTALAVANLLNARGVKTELTVIGCVPPAAALPAHISVVGFVDTRQAQGQALLRSAILNAHFLLVPSRLEPYGNVFPEANALGVPCIGTNVGGIPTIIRDGRNGRTFPLDADPGAYADYIADAIQGPAYSALAHAAFDEYHQRLSWKVAGEALSRLLRGLPRAHAGGTVVDPAGTSRTISVGGLRA